jgi:hypothetical protein
MAEAAVPVALVAFGSVGGSPFFFPSAVRAPPAINQHISKSEIS